MERSAVFMVPMMRTFCGNSQRAAAGQRDLASRYSSRYISSPKTRARLARLISSMMSTQRPRRLECLVAEVKEAAGHDGIGQSCLRPLFWGGCPG